MKKKYVMPFYFSLLLVFFSSGQAFAQMASTDPMQVDSENTVVTETVFGEDGSIQFSSETIKLLNDATYRANKYPSEYQILQVPGLLEIGDISFALWTLMNVYKSYPEKVQAIAFKLADHGIAGSQYLNAFYTYAFTDPEIFVFPEGQEPFLQNPQRLEEKLECCQTLAVYSNKYLKMKSDAK